jgi:hypothetical protein
MLYVVPHVICGCGWEVWVERSPADPSLIIVRCPNSRCNHHGKRFTVPCPQVLLTAAPEADNAA